MKDLIKRLSYDKLFGMLTRNAIEIELEKLPTTFDCCIVDFNNMKKLNQIVGYEKVNQIMFKIFREFQESSNPLLVGRWFSGDEIIIVDKAIKCKIAELDKVSKKHGMTFKEHFYSQVRDISELKEYEVD